VSGPFGRSPEPPLARPSCHCNSWAAPAHHLRKCGVLIGEPWHGEPIVGVLFAFGRWTGADVGATGSLLGEAQRGDASIAGALSLVNDSKRTDAAVCSEFCDEGYRRSAGSSSQPSG